MYLIYKYENSVNGKVYIGQTSKSLEERAQANGRNYRECRRFYNAIKKYSWSSFVPSILAKVDTVDEANELEEYYIRQYNSMSPEYGYNIAPGGSNSAMSDETKQLISSLAVERYKDKTKNPMYGKKHSAEALEKQREKKLGKNNPMYGTHWTDKQRKYSGTKGKKLNLSDAQRKKMADRIRKIGKTVGLRAVHCIEDDLKFDSVVNAAKHYGVSKSTLCGHLRGYQHTCCGKHFEYID